LGGLERGKKFLGRSGHLGGGGAGGKRRGGEDGAGEGEEAAGGGAHRRSVAKRAVPARLETAGDPARRNFSEIF
jgi:hypothetical protein